MPTSKVYTSLQKVSVALQSTELKKSGKNKFAGFKYFELGDFLPTINRLFLEHNLCGFVSFTHELASLHITHTEDGTSIEITSPMVEINMKGANEIQALGAVQTYQRRYLYLAALGIVENDVVDSREMKSEPKTTFATTSQIDKIINLIGSDMDRESKVFEYYKINEYKELTIQEASKCIKQLQK